MAAVMAAIPNGPLNSGTADTAPLKVLSISTTAKEHSPSSVSSPASAASLSNVSTPTTSSAAPPIAIKPSTANSAPASAPMNMTASSSLSPASMSQPKTMSMTSKEWVIPPRPKPGRKPATDTPPTKRKAQNRAAQRAFRERRAARVGELEEQLEEEKASHNRMVRELQERISHLEVETQALQSRCQWLESMLEKERQGRGSMVANWDNGQHRGTARNDGLTPAQTEGHPGSAELSQGMRSLQPAPPRKGATHSLPIAEPRPIGQPFSISQIVSPAQEAGTVDLGCGSCQTSGTCACAEEVLRNTDIAMGCGKCSLGTRCECLEETLRASMSGPDLKRPLPPSSPPPTSPEEKRQRSNAGIAMETEFTAMFSSQRNRDSLQSILPPPTQSQLQPLASIEPRDPCGFCKEGTYCVCADTMVTSTSMAAPASQQMVEQTQTQTPPPSDADVVPLPMEVTATGAIKLPGVRSLQQTRTARPPASTGGGCGPNGPGTCAQCLADPKSGLFCRSLAASFEKNSSGSSGSGCCGNGGPGGCCKSERRQAQPGGGMDAAGAANANANVGFGLSLSCADAYKTLSSHRHFDEAADDIGSWIPKLKALPVPRLGPGPAGGRGRGRDGRAPIEVEAASIMSVLKDFDVRFGRGE
ncbi:hypothetical protein C8A03DRAFT_14210 [Achaetomium macrosporum]|uniref:BZIP domain-containing protein n=1 Tax=Achaetomium macrosporum TaxID=79813 RepID=A0AAN7HC53_9PEZI|nr:hypothetical protein C8A03DRAFT_14210 [Achaetomium macrosporum]